MHFRSCTNGWATFGFGLRRNPVNGAFGGGKVSSAPASGRAVRGWVFPALATAVLALSACGGGGGSASRPDVEPNQPPPVNGGFSPDRERPVGFPAPFHGGLDQDEPDLKARMAKREADKLSAMHGRGGTGKGQIVGTIEAGAHRDHPDLAGQFAHICAMGLCNGTAGSGNDGRPELDRDDHSPLYDTDGHGTPVNGVVAAKRNDVGVYGVAYEARIASWGNTQTVGWPWGNEGRPSGTRRPGDQWSELFDQQIARGVDWMRSLGVRVVNNSWGRAGRWRTANPPTAAYIRDTMMPKTLKAFEAYVGAGGVAVWAAGNGGADNPEVEAMLPRYFPALEKGWLAVANLNDDGRIDQSSHYCGAAANWCITAPGVLISTNRGGKWEIAAGTSISAPYVAAGLAALKSMFPNLSHHQLRERILVTADKTGDYANRAIYGQGLLDLDAASRPVGGTGFALGARATGPVVPTAGTRAVLPEGVVGRYLAGRTITVLDGYQRAPFEVGLDTFAEPRRAPYLSLDDLALAPHRFQSSERNGQAAVAAAGGGYLAQGLAEGHHFVGFGMGPQVARGLARLSGALPLFGDYRMSPDAMGVAMGFAGESGRWHALAVSGAGRPDGPGFGVAGWNPQTVLGASFAPDRAGEVAGAEAFGVSFASELERPMGWEGSGALALRGDSFEFAWRHNLAAGEGFRLDLTNRVTHLAMRSGPLLQLDDALLASAMLEVSYQPHRFITVGARLGTERPVSAVAGRIRAASRVDETGRITYRDIAIDNRDLLAFDKAALSVSYTDGSNASFGLGIAAVQDGFGRTEALTGVRLDLEF